MNNNFNPYYQLNNRPYTGSSIIWVQGLEGARSYQLMPNSSAVLMDNENEGVFYIKTSDNVGMCNLRSFKYAEMTTTTPVLADTSQFITRDEVMELIDRRMKTHGNKPIQSAKQPNTKSVSN